MKKTITQISVAALMLLAMTAHTQDNLFISELIDPADDYAGRFIELYNAGSETVDFNSTVLFLSRQSNGGTSWGDVQLTGSVAAGETYLIGGSSFSDMYGFPPDQESGILIGNGDDAYFLFLNGDHSSGTLLDIFGEADVDGTGQAWEYTDSRALRMENISSPNIVWDAGEWLISSANIADANPGIHFPDIPDDTIVPPGDFSLAIRNDTVNIGQPVEIAILANGLSLTDGIISYQFDIHYNSLSLEYNGYSLTGTVAEGGSLAVNNAIPGTLSISYMNILPLPSSGEILRLQFNSLALDTTLLSLSNAMLNNTDVTLLSEGTLIVRSNVPPSAALTFNDSSLRYSDTLMISAAFSEQMDAANPVLISFDGAVDLAASEMNRINPQLYTFSFPIPIAAGRVSISLSNGTDVWGNEVLALPTAGTSFNIIEFTPGDVDDDGLILAYDAALTLQHSVGLDPLPDADPLPWENWRDSTANVDRQAGITAYDAGLILQYSAGIISGFSSQLKKSPEAAELYIEVAEDALWFYSSGNMIGLNIQASNKEKLLGVPVTIGSGYMTASNINEYAYNFGLCNSLAPEAGKPFLKIPILHSGSISLKLLVNSHESMVDLDLYTGFEENTASAISIYPNPVSDYLHIDTEGYFKGKDFYLRVYNQLGERVFEQRVAAKSCELDLSALGSKGLHSVQLIDIDGENNYIQKVMIQ